LRGTPEKPDPRHGAGQPEESGGPPRCIYPTEEALVYVTCPDCGGRISDPFQRYSGPVAFVHRHSKRPNGRMIVIPDPHGEDHRVLPVGDGYSLEDALVWALKAEGLA
jgi:hypothetical protein